MASTSSASAPHPSRGLKKGVIVNIDSTVASIKQAIARSREHVRLRDLAGLRRHRRRPHQGRELDRHGARSRTRRSAPPTSAKVLELARAIALPVDRHIIHVLPQEYKIDGQDGVREPLGMCGVRLEARVHIVTAAAAAAQNIIKCCTPLRPGGARHRARAAGLGRGGARGRREGARRRAGRHRRRHHRHRHLHRGGGRPHQRHPDRRPPADQRHRLRPAHAAARGGEDQEPLRLRAVADGRRGRDHRGRLGRRPRAARAVAPDALPRHRPAAHRGDLLVRQGRDRPPRLRGHARPRAP